MTCASTTPPNEDPGACPCGLPDFPVVICNPANQPRIAYRVGDYLAFRDRLLRPLPGETQLTTWRPGAEGDLAVQMMEWWAYLADILTFYNERIANEAYLRTAQLPESVNHLVQVLGYRPRPAFGARVTLAGLLTSTARLPVLLPEGLQVQSKPGPGLPPQVFELDARGSLQAPDIISTGVTPAQTPVATPPTSTSTSTATAGDGGLWIAGKVTSVKVGDNLLLINGSALAAAPTLGDFAWIHVTDVQAATDPAGKPVTALTYTFTTSTLASGGQTADYVLLKSGQSSPLWGFPMISTSKVISDTSLDLAGLARTMTAGSLFLLDVPSGGAVKPAARLVATYAESFWYANCGTAAAPTTPPDIKTTTPVGIPLSSITFDALSGAGGLNAATVTVRYGFKSVGDLVPVLTKNDLSYPAGGSSITPGAPGAVFPPGETTVLLEDAVGGATLAVLSAADATTAAIAPSPPNDALTLASPMDVMFNLLPFSRGKTVPLEVLGSGNPVVMGQDFTLQKSPVTYFADPASVSGDGFSSTVQVSVNNTLWSEARSFHGQGPNARIYVLSEDDAGQTHVTFGDGTNGARPPTGVNNIIATYRYGAGAAAPLSETLTVVQTPQPGLKGVRNPLVPTGGGDADSPARLRGLAPQSVLTFNRAVSLDDYAAIALSNSSVSQAVAGYAFDPLSQRPRVTLWVAPDGAAPAASQALAGITMPGQGLNIVQAKPIETALSLTFLCDSTLDAPAIQAALTTALTDPDTGLFGARVIGIGQVIYDSQIEAACLAVAGVSAVRGLTLETGWINTPIIFYGFKRSPSWFRKKPPAGCAGRRHDPGSGAYFQLTSLTLNPQIGEA